MRKRMNISLDPETAEQLKELAEKSHMNMSQWITQAVWESSNKNKQQNNNTNKHNTKHTTKKCNNNNKHTN